MSTKSITGTGLLLAVALLATMLSYVSIYSESS